jgi:hypothetical protein
MATPQNTLLDHQAFLMNIGYLATINGKGPFSGIFAQSAIGQFNIRENIKDVAVGDLAFTGSEWGKVKSVTGNTTSGFSFVVKFNNTVLPQGVDHATWNPSREQTYAAMLPAAANVTGLVTNNNWQKLASMGVLIVEDTNPSVQTLILQTSNLIIDSAGNPVTLDFNIGNVSVQKIVNDVDTGSPEVADSNGVVSMPNTENEEDSVSYRVSLNGKVLGTFGPYIVLPFPR